MKKLLMLALALVLCACGAKVTTGESNYKFTDKNGVEQTVTVSVELEDGKITTIAIDETYTHDGEQTTKKTLKEGYGMTVASPIGKDWFEQIAHLEETLVGTDGTIEVDEKGYPTNEDVKAGCTINLGTIAEAVKEAVASAK